MMDWLYKLAGAHGVKKFLPSLLRKGLVALGTVVGLYLGPEAGAAFGEIVDPLVTIGTIAASVALSMLWKVKEVKATGNGLPPAAKPVIVNR